MLENCQCEILRTTRELEAFRTYWDVLWSTDSNATPFQSSGWLLPWWHQFGQPELRVVAISRNGKYIAFLPFYIYSDPIRKERQLLFLGVGTSDYLDGVFASDCRTEDIKMALDQLKNMGDWDVLYAVQLRQESKLFKALQQANYPEMQSFQGENCSRVQAVSIRELPVKIRRNAMYYRNRAMRLGDLSLKTAHGQNLHASFDMLVRLHTARWQSKEESGVLADPRVLACHKEAIPALEQLGVLSLNSLCLNDEVIAIAYSFIDPIGRPQRTQYIYIIAHSIKHAELRPGTLLLASIFDNAADTGIEMIDMLRGEEAYKQLWHVESIPTFGFIVHRNIL